jgi:signal transduction histidine kinase
VVLTLVLLLVTPLVVSRRVAELRRRADDLNRVRLVVNDLEAARVSETLAQGERTVRARDVASVARAQADSDERALDSLVSPGDSTVRLGVSALRSPNLSALDFVSAAERFDAEIAGRLALVRDEIMRLEAVNVTSAAVLTPIALLSVLAVLWTGHRVREVAHELDAERAALARSMDTRAALLRGITHDVKNPLGAAAGYADLLADGIGGSPLTAEQRTMVVRIRRLISVSLETISGLLQVEHVAESAGSVLPVTSVDVGGLVADLVEDYRAAASEKSLALEIEPSGGTVVARVNAPHVQHIVGNLLSNAVKYTPPHGLIRVHVGIEAHDGTPAGMRIDVRDTGPGVPVDLRERVFDEFFRADASAASVSGDGVGLAISRRFARLLGGDVVVGDAPEGGAMFTLRLPLEPEDQRRTA